MSTYQREIDEAVETKLLELDGIAYGAATGRRYEAAAKNGDGSLMTPSQLRDGKRRVMTDIAQRLGLHFFQMTDAVMLDQLIAVSAMQNHDTAGLLRSLINSFLITYTNQETTTLAFQQLQGLELLRGFLEKGVGEIRH